MGKHGMDEFCMDKSKAGKPFFAGKVTLVPIERTIVHSHNEGMAHWLNAVKKPYAIIICDETGIRSFDLESKEIPLELLAQEVPGLDEFLSSLTR